MPPRATALILACAASATTLQAQAIGFGRVAGSVVLGQSLDLPVPLHLDPGERVGPECISAEVVAGDSRFGRDQVRVRLEPSKAPGATDSDWIARVTTQAAIVEPVIEVTLNVGCERRFSRRFTAFADPPSQNTATAAAPPARVAAKLPPASAETGEAGEVPPAARPPRAAPSGPARRHARAASAASEPAASRARASRRVAKEASVARQAAPGGNRLLLEPSPPRLKLDLEDPIIVPRTPVSDGGAGETAASATGEAGAQSAADAGRIQALENSLAQLRREAESQGHRAALLQARVTDAERRGQAIPWLASVLALALLVAGWLTFRLRRQQASGEAPQWWTPEPESARSPEVPSSEGLEPPSDWRHAEAPAPSGFAELVSEATAPLPVALSIERESPPAANPERTFERTTALAGAPLAMPDLAAADAGVREVSVEELLDLEQQADFFIALGQEDAAIDLLMSHLRSTGGLSPLPYTKLLEIYRRQGDREAYERIRARFNRRFNAYAPDWEAGPMSGRALEEYPQAVQELQARWADPLDAMAVLEAMLFRKNSGHELFDLPAYRDVLVLYAVARDLWQQAGASQSVVDVLLPLGDEQATHVVGPGEPSNGPG